MYRIVYTSTARKMMTDRDLQKILRPARTNNAANLITGMLIYHDGCFMQVLEGEQAAVEACFAKVCKDSRHDNIITLSSETIVSRIFTDWWMTYQDFNNLVRHQKSQFVDLTALSKQARLSNLIEDPKTNALLMAFLSGFRDLDMVG